MRLTSNQYKKISRNDLCPCGSGQKYKNCCSEPAQQRTFNAFVALFKELPLNTQIFYLDTCAWSEIAESESTLNNFAKFIKIDNRVAAISSYGLFELSKNSNLFTDTDSLFYGLRNWIYVPLLYDYVIAAELRIFPKIYTMRWLPLSVIVDQNTPNLLETITKKSEFIDARDGLYQFGLDHFMGLEKLKT